MTGGTPSYIPSSQLGVLPTAASDESLSDLFLDGNIAHQCLTSSLVEIRDLKSLLTKTTGTMHKHGEEAADCLRRYGGLFDEAQASHGTQQLSSTDRTTGCDGHHSSSSTSDKTCPGAQAGCNEDFERAEVEQNLLNEIQMRDSEITALEADVRMYRKQASEATERCRRLEASIEEQERAICSDLQELQLTRGALAERDSIIAERDRVIEELRCPLETPNTEHVIPVERWLEEPDVLSFCGESRRDGDAQLVYAKMSATHSGLVCNSRRSISAPIGRRPASPATARAAGIPWPPYGPSPCVLADLPIIVDCAGRGDSYVSPLAPREVESHQVLSPRWSERTLSPNASVSPSPNFSVQGDNYCLG